MFQLALVVTTPYLDEIIIDLVVIIQCTLIREPYGYIAL